MTIGQMMLGEFDQEMQNTRKTLERCPDEKWNWKPHEKSGTVGWLAGHIATMPGWVAKGSRGQPKPPRIKIARRGRRAPPPAFFPPEPPFFDRGIMKHMALPEAYHEYGNSRHSLRCAHTDRKISRWSCRIFGARTWRQSCC